MKNYLQVAFVVVLSVAIGLLLIDGLVRETGARSHGPMMQRQDREGQGHWMNQADTEFFQQMHQRADERLEELKGLVESVKNSSGDQKLEAMETLLLKMAEREKRRLQMMSQPMGQMMRGDMPMMDQMPMMPGMMMQMRNRMMKDQGGQMRPHGGERSPGRGHNRDE